jgi:hypothetical protein
MQITSRGGLVSRAPAACASSTAMIIDPVVYAEVSIGFSTPASGRG